MKSFHRSKGWLFPLVGGPQADTVLRLPWPEGPVKDKTSPVVMQQVLYERLPTQVTFGGGTVVYDRQPALDRHGERKQATGAPKHKVPAYEYVYREGS